MSVALLSIGTELLRGEIDNANARWLGEHLTQLGFEVDVIDVCGDDPKELVARLTRLIGKYPILIATGGLGPTHDDVTTQAASAAFGLKLVENEAAMAMVQRRLEKRETEWQPGHQKQATLPETAELIPNGRGTAPGFVLCKDGTTAFFLPGVPHEMRAMFSEHVANRVLSSISNNRYHIMLHTFGVAESWIAERLDDLQATHPLACVGYRVRSSEVDVRIEATGTDFADARQAAKAAAADARKRLGDAVYGEGEQSLPQLAGKSVRARGWTLAVAESCTGGLIAQQLTSQPASDFFIGGMVAYANTVKTKQLGVSEDTLRGHGAVSAEVAAEMAEGARIAFSSDVAVGVTGIAGPSGATPGKPVGLCYWAVSTSLGTTVEERVFTGNRGQVQKKAAKAALNLLRRTVDGTAGVGIARAERAEQGGGPLSNAPTAE